jgi:hypothetical protein
MNPRQTLLTTLFESLEANGVRFCILRNYENLYTMDDTDVDLLVSPFSLACFERCLREAAARAQFRFVHAARYVNYSYVFWHRGAGFTRIDFETDVRWRLFAVLFAREVLDARLRHGEFFIPDPRHESVILFLTAVWRGTLSSRYRRQLARLYDACPDKARLRETLENAFGATGEALLELQARAATGTFDEAFCGRVRRSIIRNNHRHARRLAALLRNAWGDALRLLNRLRTPAGISLLYVGGSGREQNFDELFRRIEFLFPAKKCTLRKFDLTVGSAATARWGVGLRLLRLRTLFKGGLFVRAYRLPQNADLLPLIHSHSRYLFPSRTIVCLEDRDKQLYFGHVATGFMAVAGPPEASGEPDLSQLFIEFVSNILERRTAAKNKPPRRPGVFCVLVGLDGAGKTTLARNLCQPGAHDSPFCGVRYFHWQPKIFKDIEFPFPEFKAPPRKNELARNRLNTALSVARLVKNVVLANLAYWMRVRSLLRRGYLVLVDRYFYNYYLDPVSVKYYGPAGFLDRMRRLFPQPDMVLKLGATREVLRQRKQELSEAEIVRQISVLDQLQCDAAVVVGADASQPAARVARDAMNAIVNAAGPL